MKAQGFRDVQEIAYLKALLECPSNYSPSDQSVQPTKTDEDRKFIFITFKFYVHITVLKLAK